MHPGSGDLRFICYLFSGRNWIFVSSLEFELIAWLKLKK